MSRNIFQTIYAFYEKFFEDYHMKSRMRWYFFGITLSTYSKVQDFDGIKILN
jgi:hypothetical protein